ncbi:MAG: CAP domain-containing protein [Actinomycetota bacterium]|nr:CAP domain-containing protein [Actinomycetota bacterium]
MSITPRAQSRARLAGVIAALGVLVATALVTAPAQAATNPATAPTWTASGSTAVLTLAPVSTATQYERDVVTATNAARVSRGLRAMTVTSCLDSLASRWATHLAATHTLTHQSLGPFLTNCHATAAAENIAQGNVTASNVVTLWLNSPEHRANLLNSAYTHVAIGAAQSGGLWYVVQDFSN